MRLKRLAMPVVLLATLCACERAPEPQPAREMEAPLADHVFLNGYIYTADGKGTVAQALAVRDDRIVFVGGNSEARTYVTEATRVHGLDGRLVLPGLHDTHIHLLGLVDPEQCDLNSKPRSLDEIVPILAECLAAFPLQEGWLVADQWNFSVGNQPTDEIPTMRAALDRVSADVPIFLRGNDGHHAAVNSAALARATAPGGQTVGLSARTLATHFRKYRQYVGVDERGQPNGILSESARRLVRPPDLWGFSRIEPSRIEEIAGILARSGLTSVQDAAMLPAHLELFEELARRDRMTFRLTAAMHPDFDDFRDARTGRVDIAAVVEELKRQREHFRGHPVIKATAAKLFIDGVIEGNPMSDPPSPPNAAVLSPYEQPRFAYDEQADSLELLGYVDLDGEVCAEARRQRAKYLKPEAAAEFKAANGIYPQQCEISHGVLEHDEAFIRNYMHVLRENDFVIHVHAIGDRAMRVAVANFRALRDEFGPGDLPHAIAHAQLIHPYDRSALGELGLFVTFTFAWMTPDFLYDMSVIPFISRVRGTNALYAPRSYAMKNLYPVQSVIEAGGTVTAGSDAPVDTRDPRPFVNIAAAVSRANPAGLVLNATERISIHEAIAGYTRNGARALQQEKLTGTLEAGKKADLIVLSQNIVDMAEQGNAAGLASAEVLMTMFDGRIIYQAQ